MLLAAHGVCIVWNKLGGYNPILFPDGQPGCSQFTALCASQGSKHDPPTFPSTAPFSGVSRTCECDGTPLLWLSHEWRREIYNHMSPLKAAYSAGRGGSQWAARSAGRGTSEEESRHLWRQSTARGGWTVGNRTPVLRLQQTASCQLEAWRRTPSRAPRQSRTRPAPRGSPRTGRREPVDSHRPGSSAVGVHGHLLQLRKLMHNPFLFQQAGKMPNIKS